MDWAIEHWTTILTEAGLGTLAVAAVLGAWWLWWRLPKRQVDRLRLTIRDPKARADVEDNFRKTIGQLLGGFAVLLGTGFAYIQFVQQQQTSQQQFSQQQLASRALLISNQVSKGFEQLGSDRVVVRLGGIYALEGVMNPSEQYYQAVLEALSAFVRDSTRTDTGDGPPATDIQAVLTVIGRRKPLFTAEIVRTTPFRTTASGTVAFRAPGPNLDFVHIPKANLVLATLNEVSLEGANLSGADLGFANLMAAHLNGANLSSANLSGASLIYAHLDGADLSFANLSGTRLSGAHLNGVHLIGVRLNYADLSGADLSGADLSRAIVSQAQLDHACGRNATLDSGLTLKPPGLDGQCASEGTK
jgi:uncharacterized protein YjbI with pentapeptide repeats